jgi:CubicO group peptidase (beta-lactamase class C family)
MLFDKCYGKVNIFLFSVFLCLVSVLQVFAQGQPGAVNFKDNPALPEGVKGERIKAFIVAVNSQQPDRIREFFEKNCTEKFKNFAPMDQHISIFQRFYQDTGGVEFQSVRSFVPEVRNVTAIIVKGRTIGTWRVNFMWLKVKDALLIDGINMQVERPSVTHSGPALSEEGFLQNLRELMGKFIENDMFSGSLLVARGDEVLLTMAGGEASKRFHVPNNINTKFNLGSMNKMFTATSIMQLVETGKLSLDDPISKYVDESWLDKEISSKITIHHLLCHTSGLGSYFNDSFMKGSRALFRDLNDFKPLVKDEKPAFEPGTGFQYSNTGMLLLGVVIESVTGKSYFDYVCENVFDAAGMVNSDSYEMDYPVENLAIGYSRDNKSPYGWQNNLYKHVIKGGPAGGGFSTVHDLHHFAMAMKAGKLVSSESLDEMWKIHGGRNYGYGFVIENGHNGKVVGHSGGFPGINSILKIYLDKDYIVAVMSNYDGAATAVAQEIDNLILREGPYLKISIHDERHKDNCGQSSTEDVSAS